MKTVYISAATDLERPIDHVVQCLDAMRQLRDAGFAVVAPRSGIGESTLQFGDRLLIQGSNAMLRLGGESLFTDAEKECAKRANVPVFFSADDVINSIREV